MTDIPDTDLYAAEPSVTATERHPEHTMDNLVSGPLRLDENLGKQLPHGHQIYTRLREGAHLSADSPTQFALFRELEQHRDSYTHLFALLGYELVYHPNGFFYFVYPDSVTSQSLTMSRKVALLIYTLIDYLQDNNFDPLATITGEAIARRTFEDTRDHYPDLYQQADLASTEAINGLLEWMNRRGFCQFTGDDQVRFLKPVSRFLEAVEQVTENTEATENTAEVNSVMEDS